MPGHVRVNNTVNVVGDDVSTSAQNIRRIGEDMYSHLRSLVSAGLLRGEGIEQALTASHSRWNAACNDFADAEQRFGEQCHNTYTNTMATDLRCGGYFNAA